MLTLSLEIEVTEAVEVHDLCLDTVALQEAPKPIAAAVIAAIAIEAGAPPIEAQGTAVEHVVRAVTNHQHAQHHAQAVTVDQEAAEPALEAQDTVVQDAAARAVAEALDLVEVQEVLAEA